MTPHANALDEMRALGEEYHRILDELFNPANSIDIPKVVPWSDIRFRRLFYARLTKRTEGATKWEGLMELAGRTRVRR